MDYYQMTAPCGLDCFNCPAHLAIDDQGVRAHISKMFGIPIDKAACRGCRIEGGTCLEILGQNVSCGVYTCTDKKGIQFCCGCNDFPCDNLHPYADQASVVPHNTKVFNLCLIKKMGLETWAKDKAKNVRDTYYSGKFKL
jgi:hypothetical protein